MQAKKLCTLLRLVIKVGINNVSETKPELVIINIARLSNRLSEFILDRNFFIFYEKNNIWGHFYKINNLFIAMSKNEYRRVKPQDK